MTWVKCWSSEIGWIGFGLWTELLQVWVGLPRIGPNLFVIGRKQTQSSPLQLNKLGWGTDF
jgi:hypothetical protein